MAINRLPLASLARAWRASIVIKPDFGRRTQPEP
jgi:hypothetical protein